MVLWNERVESVRTCRNETCREQPPNNDPSLQINKKPGLRRDNKSAHPTQPAKSHTKHFNPAVKFRVSAQNVNGFQQKKKREIIIMRHKTLGDILFFQETFVTPKIADELEKTYPKDRIFHSQGTNRSCGVMILIKGALDVEIKKIHKDQDGRLLLINCEIEGTNFLLLNVYAPNNREENASFLSKVTEVLTAFQTDPIDHILAEGDWNSTENIEFDRLGGNPKQWPKSLQNMRNMKETFDLVDIWRIKFPHEKKFTWKSLSRGIFSRIDRFYVSESLQSILESTDILPGILSNHSILQIVIKSKEFERGTGFWRLNTNLLGNPEYTKNRHPDTSTLF